MKDRPTIPQHWALMPSHAGAIRAAYTAGAYAGPQSKVPAVRGRVAIMGLFGLLTQHGLRSFDGSPIGTSTDAFGRTFRAAVQEPSIKGIVIDVDSPGGTVPGTQELASIIYNSRNKKPVVAVANSLAASAAYWIASAASEFVATPSADVGSIGIFSLHEDWSEHDRKMGVTTSLIHAGRFKVEANPWEALSAEARAEMQRRVDAMYQTFVLDVARNRKVSAGRVLQGFGQGRVVRSGPALAEGMTDGIRTLDEVLGGLNTSRPTGQPFGIDASLTRMLETAWGDPRVQTGGTTTDLRRKLEMRRRKMELEEEEDAADWWKHGKGQS